MSVPTTSWYFLVPVLTPHKLRKIDFRVPGVGADLDSKIKQVRNQIVSIARLNP